MDSELPKLPKTFPTMNIKWKECEHKDKDVPYAIKDDWHFKLVQWWVVEDHPDGGEWRNVEIIP